VEFILELVPAIIGPKRYSSRPRSASIFFECDVFLENSFNELSNLFITLAHVRRNASVTDNLGSVQQIIPVVNDDDKQHGFSSEKGPKDERVV
jgi:hypothetical protein